MKIILITISLVLLSQALACTGNDLNILNVDVTPSGAPKIHYGFKYANMTVKHHLLNETETDIEAIFKFIWNYSDDAEKQKGHDVFTSISQHLTEVREDYGLVMVFTAKDFSKLKMYREGEF